VTSGASIRRSSSSENFVVVRSSSSCVTAGPVCDTQRSGSVWIDIRPSSTRPAPARNTPTTSTGTTQRPGNAVTRGAPNRTAALAQEQQRGGEPDAPGDEQHDTDRQHRAEVLDHRHLREPQREEPDGGGDHGDDEWRRHRAHGALRRGRGAAPVAQLLLEAVLHLDGEIDTEPDEDRQT